MYFLVSVPNEAFHRVMSLRGLQRRLGIDTSVYRNASDLLRNVEKSFGGRLVLLDWPQGKIVANIPVAGASGLAVEEDFAFASSWTDHSVHILQRGRPPACISHHWFNHLHTVELTPQRTLLIASAGIDLIVELSLEGQVVWHWFGPEHGYGAPAVLDDATDYRAIRRSTSERALHVTSALPVDGDRVLAALFHQGEVIAIDRRSGQAQTVLRGLVRPHGIHRHPAGYIVSDTLGHRILLLDEALNVCSEIPFGSQWLQDTIPTSAGTYLALENVHIDQAPEPGLTNRMVELDRAGRPLRTLTIPPDYRLFTAREVESGFAQWMMEEWGGSGGLENWLWE
jgi:hypothetical protein